MSDLLTLHPIGLVHRDDRSAWLEIDPPYRGGLLELGRFSHIIVLWWVSGHDSDESRAMLQTELPYAPGVTAACSRAGPNTGPIRLRSPPAS